MRRLLRSRPLLVVAVAIVLVASIGANRLLRRALLPAELRYVPKENSLLVITGDLETLWSRFEHHFGPAIRDTSREGPLRSMLEELDEMLDERKLPIKSARDLATYGIDRRRGVIVSAAGVNLGLQGPSARSPQFLVVIPATDSAAVERFVATFTDMEPAPDQVSDGSRTYAVTRLGEDGELFMASPEAGVVLVATSADTLRRALFGGDDNRRAALENDDLYDGVGQLLGRPLMSGASVFGFWRVEGTPLQHMTLAVDLGRSDVVISGDFSLARGVLKVVDQLGQDVTMAEDWASSLPNRTIGAAALQDDALGRYLQLGASVPALRDMMMQEVGGVLFELRTVSALRRVAVAVTGFRDGVPDVLVGVWGNPSQVRMKIDAVRMRVQRERDLAVLGGAESAVRDRQAEGGDQAALNPAKLGVDDLFTSGLLTPEPGGLLTSYRRGPTGWIPPPVAAFTLAGPSDTAVHRDTEIRYITPRLGDNDLRFRDEFAEADPALVKSDRYRLATITLDDVTWLATDTESLRGVLDVRAGDAKPLTAHALFSTARATWGAADKVQMFINVDEVAATAATSTDGELDWFRTMLLDFQQQPSVAARLRPPTRTDTMRLLWTMTRARP